MKNQYPLDFDSLEKGQTFDEHALRQILGEHLNPGDFELAVLQLRTLIENRCELSARCHKRPDTGLTLVLLTDPQSAVYNNDRCQQAARAFGRRLRKQAQVDPGNLTPAQSRTHEWALARNAAQYHAFRRAALIPPPDPPLGLPGDGTGGPGDASGGG